MANPSWDGLNQYVFQTVALGATTAKLSESFNIPRAIQTVTIIVPAQATDTTMVVEGLSPLDKTTWTPVTVATAPGTFVALVLAVSTTVTTYLTIPATYFGTGTFRFSNATDQTTTTPIQIIFDRMGSR